MPTFKKTSILPIVAMLLVASVTAVFGSTTTNGTTYFTFGSGHDDTFAPSTSGVRVGIIVVNPVAAKTYTIRQGDPSTGGILWQVKMPATLNSPAPYYGVLFHVVGGLTDYVQSDDVATSANLILYSQQ